MRLRLLLLSPFLLLLVVFALSNTRPVPIGLWPTGLTIELPLAGAILLGTAVGLVLGALIVWVPGLAHRRRARRAEAREAALRTQLEQTRIRLVAPQ